MLKRVLQLVLAAVLGTTLGVIALNDAKAADSDVYTQPGHHYVNGRYWSAAETMQPSHSAHKLAGRRLTQPA